MLEYEVLHPGAGEVHHEVVITDGTVDGIIAGRENKNSNQNSANLHGV